VLFADAFSGRGSNGSRAIAAAHCWSVGSVDPGGSVTKTLVRVVGCGGVGAGDGVRGGDPVDWGGCVGATVGTTVAVAGGVAVRLSVDGAVGVAGTGDVAIAVDVAAGAELAGTDTAGAGDAGVSAVALPAVWATAAGVSVDGRAAPGGIWAHATLATAAATRTSRIELISR